MRLALAAAMLPAAVVLAACSGSASSGPGPASSHGTTSKPKAAAGPSSRPAASADTIPMLHKGVSVKLPYVTEAGTQGAEATENTTWTLTSVNYIPYAQAVAGGVDDDTAADLGADALKTGDRYLVLGLTIDDNGPAGFDDDFPIGNAEYAMAYHSNGKIIASQVNAYCMSQAPPGTTPPAGHQFVSGLCSTGTVQPGQTVNGYLFVEVPDTPALLFVVGDSGTQEGKPILAIDPSHLVAKSVCSGSAAFC